MMTTQDDEALDVICSIISDNPSLKSSPYPCCIKSRWHRIVSVNYEYLRVREDDQRTMRDYPEPSLSTINHETLSIRVETDVASTKQPKMYLDVHQAEDRRSAVFLIRVEPICDEDGDVVGFIETSRDTCIPVDNDVVSNITRAFSFHMSDVDRYARQQCTRRSLSDMLSTVYEHLTDGEHCQIRKALLLRLVGEQENAMRNIDIPSSLLDAAKPLSNHLLLASGVGIGYGEMRMPLLNEKEAGTLHTAGMTEREKRVHSLFLQPPVMTLQCEAVMCILGFGSIVLEVNSLVDARGHLKTTLEIQCMMNDGTATPKHKQTERTVLYLTMSDAKTEKAFCGEQSGRLHFLGVDFLLRKGEFNART